MAKKLAITISGAVSLGSYESGVMWEVLHAIKQHNAWADANSPEERIEIDVMTGASAGGMTVAMIAQRLLYDGTSLDQPYNNPLFDAWVKTVDIEGLLQRDPGFAPGLSVLSSNLVIEISQQALMSRYAGATVPPANPHPALSKDDATVRVGFALSNLNGVDYVRPTASGNSFVYTERSDGMLRTLKADKCDTKAAWEEIRGVAVACGAFPAMFRVQDLRRRLSDYVAENLPLGSIDPLVKAPWENPEQVATFAYTDGGVFQNEPLGMAKNLVDKLTDGHTDAERRGYLFIAPQPKTGKDTPWGADPNKNFSAANATFSVFLPHLASSVISQSGFRDWITAEEVNDKIKRLDLRAGQLMKMFQSDALTPAQTEPVSKALVGALFSTVTDPEDTPINAREQLRLNYSTEYEDLRQDKGQEVADAWVDAVLVLERGAGLQEKDAMYIFDFVADPNLLASDALEAFAGFFDIRYRKHDYDYGRSKAQEMLTKYAKQKGVFENLNWSPTPIDPIDTTLNGLTMGKADPAIRWRMYNQLSDAAETLLNEEGVNVLLRKPFMWWFVEPKIKKLLALGG